MGHLFCEYCSLSLSVSFKQFSVFIFHLPTVCAIAILAIEASLNKTFTSLFPWTGDRQISKPTKEDATFYNSDIYP